MKPINISKLVKKYGPGYVAKSRKTGRVVAHAKRLDLLFKKTSMRTDVVSFTLNFIGMRKFSGFLIKL